MRPFNSPETLSFLLLPLLFVVLELLLLLLLLLLCGCVPFGLCFTRARPLGDSATALAVEEEDAEDVSERFEEALITSPGDTTGRPFLTRAVTISLGDTPAALPSSLATTLGPTVITVGRRRVNAKVEPGRGSRYGGGLLDFIVVTCVGRSGD